MGKPKLDVSIDLAGTRPWKGIVWHHSASPDGATRDWDAIVRYHTSYRVDFQIVSPQDFERRLALRHGTTFQRPWKDVGYHGGTELVAGLPTFHWGRSLAMVGAHAGVKDTSNRFNEEYLGLCCVGDFDESAPSSVLWDFNLQLTRALMEAFRIPAGHIIGHREVFDRLGVPRQKTCPGRLWSMDQFRADL